MLLALECIIGCLLFTVMILPAQYRDPISQLASYPPAIRERVESLPQYANRARQEKQRGVVRKVTGALLFVVILALVAYLSGQKTFSTAFIHVFIIFFAVNMYDLIVLDIGVFCHSKKLMIPGTEDMVHEYRSPVHHIKGAAIGLAIGTVVAALSAGLVELAMFIS